jgi:hypothetical protein
MAIFSTGSNLSHGHNGTHQWCNQKIGSKAATGTLHIWPTALGPVYWYPPVMSYQCASSVCDSAKSSLSKKHGKYAHEACYGFVQAISTVWRPRRCHPATLWKQTSPRFCGSLCLAFGLQHPVMVPERASLGPVDHLGVRAFCSSLGRH